jgi:cyclase
MYNKPRIIPVLSIIEDDLVKTVKYNNPRYLGDPINAVKIFNGKYVDELIIIDIRASLNKQPINFELLSHIAQQAFMPLGYGGGIQSLDEVKKIFRIGFEKVIFNTAFIDNPDLIKRAVEFAGSQSVVVALDFKKSILGKYNLYIKSGTVKTNLTLEDVIVRVKDLNVGEVIINVVDKDGTMSGYDLEIIQAISKLIDIPVIANTGAKEVEDFKMAILSGAHSVAASSMFVFYGKMKAVLITFPEINLSSAVKEK